MIKRKSGKCKYDGCTYEGILYSKGYCQKHYWIQNKSKNKDKVDKVLKEDESTYYTVFMCKKHECEECGSPLTKKFKDDKGKIIDRWQYSHILSKGAHPKLRNNPLNFNRLCFDCHQKWEFGDRKSMKIFIDNQFIIEKLLKLEYERG